MRRGVGRHAIATRTAASSRLMVVNRNTGEFKSLFEFFNYEQFMKDVAVITDTARGEKLSYAQLGMAIMRNFDAERAPEGFPNFSNRESLQAFVDQLKFRSQRPHEGSEQRRTRTMSGACSASKECGFRIFSTTTSAAQRCA